MTAVTAFDPRAFLLTAFQCDPFGSPRRGSSQGAKTRRRDEWLKRQWEVDEQQRIDRERRAADREAIEAKEAELAPVLEEAARLVVELHGRQVPATVENAERLLGWLTKPRSEARVEALDRAERAAETDRRDWGLDAAFNRSPDLDASVGYVDRGVRAKAIDPERVAEIIEVIQAFLGDEE